MIERRGFLKSLVGLVAAPAIVRASSIMPVKPIEQAIRFQDCGGAWFEIPHEALLMMRRIYTIENINPSLLNGRVEILHLGGSKVYSGT